MVDSHALLVDQLLFSTRSLSESYSLFTCSHSGLKLVSQICVIDSKYNPNCGRLYKNRFTSADSIDLCDYSTAYGVPISYFDGIGIKDTHAVDGNGENVHLIWILKNPLLWTDWWGNILWGSDYSLLTIWYRHSIRNDNWNWQVRNRLNFHTKRQLFIAGL